MRKSPTKSTCFNRLQLNLTPRNVNLYCSQKVGDIWTLKITALTNAMTHIWNSQFWWGNIPKGNTCMHNSLQVSSVHVTPGPHVLDQGWTPSFHMDLIWWQNVSRCRNLYWNTRHCSFFKLKICFAHCVFKLRNAWHKCIFFLGEASHLLEFCSLHISMR